MIQRGTLWRPAVPSKALVESLLTLLAPETGQQLYALQQFGAAHLKIEEPRPAMVTWMGLILGRKSCTFLAPPALPAAPLACLNFSCGQVFSWAGTDPRLLVSFFGLKRLSFVVLDVLKLVCLHLSGLR